MFRFLLYILFLDILFVSCLDKTHVGNEYLSLDIKSNSNLLKKEIIELPKDLIYSKSFYVFKDSILIVHNKKYEDVCFLEIYNLNTKDFIGKYIPYGNGPGEMLSARVKIYDNLLVINDIVKKQVAFLEIDSLLNNKNYIMVFQKYGMYTFDVIPYAGNMLMENMNCFSSKELNITNDEKRFAVITENFNYSQYENSKFYVKNVTGGSIIPNYGKDRIVYASSNYPLIEIYDGELNKIKKIIGPDDIKPKYVMVDNEIVFSKVIPYAYLDHCNDLDFFYLTYMGEYFKPGTRIEKSLVWIFKLDWDGNIVNSYAVNEYINSISLSVDKKSFYATAYDDDGNEILIKLMTQ